MAINERIGNFATRWNLPLRGLGLAAFVLYLTVIVGIGLPIKSGVRQWLFEESRPIRFTEDASRGFYWGREALTHGYFNVYDSMKDQKPDDAKWLDYAPLRLAIMRYWAGVNATRFPDKTDYVNTFEFAQPVLWVNACMELIGAIGCFLLVRHWVLRSRGASATVRANVLGLVAFTLLWFNPAMLISGYAWPTWDLWVVSFFIWAVYAVSKEWWFTAGLIVATGAMFKGQILAVAWVLFLIPLLQPAGWLLLLLLAAYIGAGARIYFWGSSPIEKIIATVGSILSGLSLIAMIGLMAWRGQWSKLLRALAGFVFAAGVIVSGWMLRKVDGSGIRALAVLWMIFVAAAIPAAFYFLRQIEIPYLRLLPAKLKVQNRRHMIYVWCACVGAALLLCMPMFHASNAWYVCGWKFGTEHFHRLTVGQPANLPALLADRFGFDKEDIDYVVGTMPKFWGIFAEHPVSLRDLMQMLFLVFTVPCAIAAAGRLKQNDPRFLIAMTAPWVLFFALPLQIHERYLLFAAGFSACLVASGLGTTLLHIFLSWATMCMTLNILLKPGRLSATENLHSIFVYHATDWRNFCSALYPDLAWAILLVALIFVYAAVVPGWRATSRVILSRARMRAEPKDLAAKSENEQLQAVR